MAFRIAQISDAHLSAARPFFQANFDRTAEAIRAARPDLLIATGDLSLDGAGNEDDLQHAARAHAGIGLDWAAIPGNHDVGEDLGNQPVTPERLARWQRVFGSQGFVRDIPGWRLIGLDTQGLAHSPPDAGHWAMLSEAIIGAGHRRVALFTHKPLCEERLADIAVNYWPMLPAQRARLMAIFGEARPALVASGHVHQWRDRTADDMHQVWAPACSFVVGAPYQWTWGSRPLGWVEHVLHEDGTHESRLMTVPGLDKLDIGHLPEVYGRLPMLELPNVAAD